METPSPSPDEMPNPRHDIELPEPPPGEYPSQTPPEFDPPPGTPEVEFPRQRTSKHVAAEMHTKH